MDKDTEKLLNLYLDDLLPEEDRKRFEDLMAKDAELRKAVDLHREAAGEMRKLPDLPVGFGDRARDRLERERPAIPIPRRGDRFWTWENAGLLAAAAILAAVIFPFLQPEVREPAVSGRSASQPAETPFPESVPPPDTGPAGPEVPTVAEEAVSFELSDMAEALEERTLKSAEAGLPELGARITRKALPVTPSPALEEETLLRETVRADALKAGPGPGISPEAPKSRGGYREGRFLELKKEISAVDQQKEAIPGPTSLQVPFRVHPYPLAIALGDPGFAVLRVPSDIAALAAASPTEKYEAVANRHALQVAPGAEPAGTGIDFGKEIGILLPAWKPGTPPIRIEVEQVYRTEDSLRILYRENSVDPKGKSALPTHPHQIVILPATGLEIEIRKID